MSFANIERALDTHLYAFSSANSLAVAWENQPFDLESFTGNKYLKQSILPAESFRGVDASTDFKGIYQVMVYVRKDQEKAAKQSIIDGLISHFSAGIKLTAGGQIVNITNAWASPALIGDSWAGHPISITYRSYV